MDRTLRWYERLVVQLLLRSPRVDSVVIMQMSGATAAERRVQAARMLQSMSHWQRVRQLERMYQMDR